MTQGATNALTLGYGFGTTNNNGNVLSQTTGGVANGAAFNFPASYSYDGLNRLKTMYEANTCARTYAYDRYGNRAVVQSAYWCMTQEPWTPQVSSDSAALVEAQFPNNRWTGGTNLSYDPAGNQLSVAGPKTFTYDAENRLATMTQGGTVSYAYDGEGRRVSKTVGTATTRYVYDAFGQLAAEYASPAPTSVPCTTCYLTADHLGSTRLVTDQAGAVVERRDYFPFGEEMPVAGSVRASIAGYPGDAGQALKFTGKERDAESGLDYFGARYFSGTQGRFTSTDPFSILMEAKDREEFDEYLADPQNWNSYAYAGNNPLKYVDPDGRNRLVAWLANPANQRLIEGHARRAAEAANRYGTRAYNALTNFFNSPTGQEITQTAVETVTDSQAPSARIGAAREVTVAAMTGGRLAGVAGEGLKVAVKGLGSTDVDVIGKSGEFIAVGGPAKALKPAELGHHLKVLKTAAEQAGVKALAYFEKGTPRSVLKIARKRLGDENVFEFER